ncbi:MAG: hypothetical protein KDK70_27275 [Myxococcales bacterium]|nr:hypothetical protein [Myxococcales bacterium]
MWIGRVLIALVMVLGAWLGGASVASATEGRPTGWDVMQATEGYRLGRMHLRYEPALAEQAAMLAANAPRWWAEIEEEIAGDVDDTVEIVFVDHSGRVAEASGMPHWVAGVAHPPTGEIIIARHAPDGSPTNLEELLRHEMVHVILHRATDGAEVPRWFHEGMAESFNGTLSLGRTQTLAAAVFGPGVPRLDRLEQSFHVGDGPQVAVAYAASRDLVEFLRGYDASGVRLRQVMTELRSGHRFEVAFIHAYGRGLGELVGQWRAGLPGRFIWYPLLASGGLPFILVAPLVVVAWIRRRRKVRLGMERLEREDALAMARLSMTVAAAEATA